MMCSPLNDTDLGFGVIHSSFEDVRVYLGYAVNSMGAHNAQMGHVDPFLSTFLNEGHAANTIIIARKPSSNVLQN